MKKIIVLGLLIIGIPVLGAMQQYAGKAFKPTATPSYGKFNIPTSNVNYNKFNQNIAPTTTYRNISSFNQQQISGYKPAITNQPNMEQARQLVEQATKLTTSDMMQKYAAARAYSTSNAQQGGSWWNKLLVWLGIGTAVGVVATREKEPKNEIEQEKKDEKELVKKVMASINKEDYTSKEYYSSDSKELQEAQEYMLKKINPNDRVTYFFYTFDIDNALAIINICRLILVEREIVKDNKESNCSYKSMQSPDDIKKCQDNAKLLEHLTRQKKNLNNIIKLNSDINSYDILLYNISNIIENPEYKSYKEEFLSSTTFSDFDSKYIEYYLKENENKSNDYVEAINKLIRNEVSSSNRKDISHKLFFYTALNSSNLNLSNNLLIDAILNRKYTGTYGLEIQQEEAHKREIKKFKEAEQAFEQSIR